MPAAASSIGTICWPPSSSEYQRTLTADTSSWKVRNRSVTGVPAGTAPPGVRYTSLRESWREPVPLDVVVGAVAGMDRQDVGRGVVGEGDFGARCRNREEDVVPVRNATGAIVLVPRFVDRDLCLIRARRQGRRRERICPITVGVLEPGAQAVRQPIAAGATELGLEAPGRGGDHVVAVVRDPVRLVVVVELHARRGGKAERDVVAVGRRVERRSSRPSCRRGRPCTRTIRREGRRCPAKRRHRRRSRCGCLRNLVASRPSSRAPTGGCPRSSRLSELRCGRRLSGRGSPPR